MQQLCIRSIADKNMNSIKFLLFHIVYHINTLLFSSLPNMNRKISSDFRIGHHPRWVTGSSTTSWCPSSKKQFVFTWTVNGAQQVGVPHLLSATKIVCHICASVMVEFLRSAHQMIGLSMIFFSFPSEIHTESRISDRNSYRITTCIHFQMNHFCVSNRYDTIVLTHWVSSTIYNLHHASWCWNSIPVLQKIATWATWRAGPIKNIFEELLFLGLRKKSISMEKRFFFVYKK